ncbi:glycosyltransferase [Nocardioides coralli]|uniref:glycosyltransferase n=1 Tax=Nocardioides coralli TaxID=2872154 RepID=UPI001CA3B44B|nr:nucleotide disphospho-sugar-binding domain-containing protein [Nocardioides coralli]QZY30281.1 hypothetical protein K6T13_06320 [Nocardioides coralli]
MSTVLAYTSPAIGHLFPMTPLLLELRSRGHEVHLRTLSSRVATMRSLGLHAEPIDPAIEAVPMDDWRARGAVGALKSSVATFVARAAHDAPDLLSAVDAVAPDLLLVDINAWGASVAAEAWGGPWARFSPYTPALSSPGTPPYGPGLRPLGGLAGRLRDGIARPVFLGAAERAVRPRLNQLRADHDLAPVRGADEFFRSAPLMLVATAEPLEYPHPDWAPGVQMIGALAWEPAAEAPDWLTDVDGDLVLVATSSEYQRDEALVRAAVTGLADGPWTVVATMPAGLTDLGPLPGNVRVHEFVPHGILLERAAVAVTHGGMGVTQKALAHGVPVCVVPFGRDQLEVAARVVHAGAGARVRSARLTGSTLRTGVEQALGCRAGAARVAAGFDAAGGAARGAELLESLLPSTVT